MSAGNFPSKVSILPACPVKNCWVLWLLQMFLCVGPAHKRMKMSMQSVYSDSEMFEKASPHMKGEATNIINHHGVLTPVFHVAGVSIEFGPGLFVRVENDTELWFASRLVVSYHDSLRTESERLDIEENQNSIYETAHMEEAILLEQSSETGFGSDQETSETREGGW
jgi:hypothetical protein